MKLKKYKLYEIVWDDHCTFDMNRWRYPSDIAKLQPIALKTVGYLIKETKKHIVVVSSLDKNKGTATGEFLIIKGTIRSVRRVK